jgi:hypothetical protein
MGGLAMPNIPLTKGDVKDLVRRYGNAKVVGVCFMSMFEKAGWLDTISFDMMICATIDPVTVTWKELQEHVPVVKIMSHKITVG